LVSLLDNMQNHLILFLGTGSAETNQMGSFSSRKKCENPRLQSLLCLLFVSGPSQS
jgi:hypothetical protein